MSKFKYTLFVSVFFSSVAFGQDNDKQPNCNEISGIEISDYRAIGEFLADNNTHTGLVKFCDENEKVGTYYTVKNGKTDGEAKGWHKNGHLLWHMIYENNKEKYRETYNGIGKKTSEEYWYRDSSIMVRGSHYEWYDNGQCKTIYNKIVFKDEYAVQESLDGLKQEWHENGQLLSEGKYIYDGDGGTDIQIGTHKKWYENGKIQEDINYINGFNKNSKYWFQNGQLKKQYSVDDSGNVNEKCWDEKGKEVDCIY